MEKARLGIQKTAKILFIICEVAQIILIVTSCIIIGCLIQSIFDEKTLDTVKSFLSSEGIIQSLIEDNEEVTKNAIIFGAIFHILTNVIYIVYLIIFARLLKKISKGEQPFTEKNAKIIFWISISLLIFGLNNFVIAIVLCIFGLFISNLIKYGAYLNKKAEETNSIQENMIVSFAEVVENKSEQTGKHVKRVAEYSKIIALNMGYSPEYAEMVKMASMMHDIGKLLVDSSILEKPGKLSSDEYQEIKKHSMYGVKLLNEVEGDVLLLARTIAHDHHERVDGKGYPDGLSDDKISLEGKIVAVADVYDALTSKRSYKEAWSEEDAYNEIVKNSGSQFDEKVVDAFIKGFEEIKKIKKKFAD